MRKFVFLFILIAGCSAQIPRWFGQSKLPEYSATNYYTGVGEGNTFADAQSDAQAAIASQLRVTIESTVETFVQELETDDRATYVEMFKKTTKSAVNETINGIEIVKTEKVGNRYYVFAALNKTRFLAGLEAELDQLLEQVSKLVRDARNSIKEGKIFVALENYAEAQEYVVQFYTKKAFYDALSPVPFFMIETITLSDTVSEIRLILSGVNIEVIGGDKQSAKAGTLLRDPIVFEVTYMEAGTEKKIPIPNMPITIKYEDGTVIERGSTNQEGQLETYVTALPITSKYGKVYARPNLVQLPPVYKKYLKKAEGSARYSTLEVTPIAFTLTIRDEMGHRLPKVEHKIARSIEKLGHIISDNAEVALDGSVSIIETKGVEGSGGLQHLVTSELSLLMVLKSTGDEVASFTANGNGLSQKSEKEAIEASYRKLNIKKKELAEMLSRAEDELKRVFEQKSAEYLKNSKILYAQGNLREAIKTLALVTHGDAQVDEATKLIKTIKAELNKVAEDRIRREREKK